MSKTNCWEFKKCGRQPGGSKANDLGVCPAAVETRVDGVNDGKNAGRSCWVLAGTMCGGAVQGSFASKLANCMSCDFYKAVLAEEGANAVSPKVVLERLGAA
jgi:hypothetical protein